jgi:hypothetical protein
MSGEGECEGESCGEVECVYECDCGGDGGLVGEDEDEDECGDEGEGRSEKSSSLSPGSDTLEIENSNPLLIS